MQLEQEREQAKIEERRQQAMKEEQELIAQQEAYEKAALEPVVIHDSPRPLPPEISESLPTVAEGDEEVGSDGK